MGTHRTIAFLSFDGLSDCICVFDHGRVLDCVSYGERHIDSH